jgi:hypothetical protein
MWALAVLLRPSMIGMLGIFLALLTLGFVACCILGVIECVIYSRYHSTRGFLGDRDTVKLHTNYRSIKSQGAQRDFYNIW